MRLCGALPVQIRSLEGSNGSHSHLCHTDTTNADPATRTPSRDTVVAGANNIPHDRTTEGRLARKDGDAAFLLSKEGFGSCFQKEVGGPSWQSGK